MADLILNSSEISRSYDVFTDPATYRPFDLTDDYQRIVGCIDPRDEDSRRLFVTIQTGGGAAGRGLDASLGLNATDNTRVYSITDGLIYDAGLERTTIAGGHNNHCRFIYGLGAVASEMQDPSDFTWDTVREFAARFDLKDAGLARNINKIRRGLGRVGATIAETDPTALLEDINNLHPYHPNVREMRGDNRAGFYIMNFHPYVGLDRMRVHRGKTPLTVHAYHDSPRAMVDALAGTLGMSRQIKDARLAALLLRTAATRTVLRNGNNDMKLLNVVQTRRGLQVQETHI